MLTKIKVLPLYLTLALFSGLLAVGGLFFVAYNSASALEYTISEAYDKEIWELNQEISDKQQAIDDLKKQTETYKKILAQKQEALISLNGQISQIDTSIAKVSLEIETLELQIEEVELKIESAELKIKSKEDEMHQKKSDMAEVVRALDRSQRQSSFLMVVATKGKLSDYISAVQQLHSLENSLFDDLSEMKKIRIALLAEQDNLEGTKDDLAKVSAELEQKVGSLSSQKYVKNALVKETQGQEAKYQSLLEKTKKEVEEANSDIIYLEKIAREKLNRSVAGDTLGADEDMMWPVPSKFVTAYFHDPDYPFRNIFEHPAIDIRAAQSTPIRAAKSGFVARAKDAGMGYSYIMLVHDDGLSTVYGHVSNILVAEDNYVTKGQIIGYSGGAPGTPGAGLLTTAPHLHFEVRVNGIPVNPLNYL